MQDRFDCISIFGMGICLGDAERLTMSKIGDIVRKAGKCGVRIDVNTEKITDFCMDNWVITMSVLGETFFKVRLSASYMPGADGNVDIERATNKFIVTHIWVDVMAWAIGVQRTYGESRINVASKIQNPNLQVISSDVWNVFTAIEYMGCKVLVSDRLCEKVKIDSDNAYAREKGTKSSNFYISYGYRAVHKDGKYRSKGTVTCVYNPVVDNRISSIEIRSTVLKNIKDTTMCLNMRSLMGDSAKNEAATLNQNGNHRRIRVVRDSKLLKALADKYKFSFDKESKYVINMACSAETSQNMEYNGKVYGMYLFTGMEYPFVVEKYTN